MNDTILSLHQTKAVEYLLAVGYLLAFVPFWRLLNPPQRARAVARVLVGVPAFGWFRVPESLSFHPGHTWVKAEPDGTLSVGLDEFASRLLGAPTALTLPEIGMPVEQGARGFHLTFDERGVDVLAPVDGTVVARNDTLRDHPEQLAQDPYGVGWLLRVAPTREMANRAQLFSGERARSFMEDAARSLAAIASPGHALAQDGGIPVSGIARELDPEQWERLAARFLLTEYQGPRPEGGV